MNKKERAEIFVKIQIKPDQIFLFAYTNQELLKDSPKGIALSFHGLNGSAMIQEHTSFAYACAEKDVLLVMPYDNPWSWMNDQAVKMVDALITAIQEKYGKDLPVVSTGGSMGGLSALIYSRYSSHRIVACAANCPVCDLPFHFTERPDLPRTITSAVSHYEGTMEAAIEGLSPLHQVEKLPRIPYIVFHCEKDQAVNKEKHSDRLVHAMRQAQHCITYVPVPDKGHCDLSPEAKAQYEAFILAHALEN